MIFIITTIIARLQNKIQCSSNSIRAGGKSKPNSSSFTLKWVVGGLWSVVLIETQPWLYLVEDCHGFFEKPNTDRIHRVDETEEQQQDELAETESIRTNNHVARANYTMMWGSWMSFVPNWQRWRVIINHSQFVDLAQLAQLRAELATAKEAELVSELKADVKEIKAQVAEIVAI